MKNKSLFTSATPEWYTPPDILMAVRKSEGANK